MDGIGADITERKRAEEEACEREAQLTHTVANAGLGHWVWDEVGGRCISCSAELARMFGFPTPESFVAASQSHEAIRARVHPDDWARYEANVSAANRDRSPTDIEYWMIRLDGEVRHVRELAVSMLRSLDCEILEAPCDGSGLAALDGTPDIVLLFSDVVLPGGVNGLELSQEARRRRPGLEVLFTSGYTEFAGIDADQLMADADLISKPFRKAELAERLRAILRD